MVTIIITLDRDIFDVYHFFNTILYKKKRRERKTRFIPVTHFQSLNLGKVSPSVITGYSESILESRYCDVAQLRYCLEQMHAHTRPILRRKIKSTLAPSWVF